MLSSLIETSYRVLLLWLTLILHPAINVQPGLGDGFWHTKGAQLLDSSNHPVRIAAVNWYGFETESAAPGGLQQQDYKTIIATIRRSGYNTIRLPFSNQMVETPSISTAIAFNNHEGPINSDLKGLNSLQVLDKIIAYAGAQGLKIILDNHRSEAGAGAGLSGLWYTQAFPESAWIADWQLLTRRYLNDSTVIGFDLRNEPHGAASGGACWSCGGPENDWHLAAQRAGNAILEINPRLLIIVEGVDSFENDFYWWGGNLMGVRSAPVRLRIPNQLVYSAHDYGPLEHGQSWLTPAMTAESLRAVWTKHWAYIAQQNIAPVWLGEFGVAIPNSPTPTEAESLQATWFQSLIKFLSNDSRLNWGYWALNGEDRYGLLTPNYDAIRDSARQEALASIQFPLNPSLSQTVIQPITPTAKDKELSSFAVGGGPAFTPSGPATAVVPTSDGRPPYLASSAPNTSAQSCTIVYTNTKDWQTGFSSTLTVHNTGTVPISGWNLTWTWNGNQHITVLWSAKFTQTGPRVTLTNETWNATIPAGGAITGIGFNASYTGTNSTPTNFTLNNTPCK
jgi:endoglucanase